MILNNKTSASKRKNTAIFFSLSFQEINSVTEVKEAEKQRRDKQIDRTDGLLAAFNSQNTEELPLLESSGEKTRKTYDFTRKYSLVMALGHRAGTSMPKL